MSTVLSSLKLELGKIAELIVDKQDVLYFDYPLHLNVGDLLIYAGTEQFFADNQITIRLRRCFQAFDIHEVKSYVNPKTTIICHGGGNFGDLYPALQKMREQLVQSFPNNRIIVLPQTAFFKDKNQLNAAAAIFSAHPDCHLFARDLPTFELMQAFSSFVQLCPDMAHQLYGVLPFRTEQARPIPAEPNILYFLRKDIEASQIEKNIQAKLNSSAVVKDWEDILSARDLKKEKYYSKLAKLANKFHFSWLKNKINQAWFAYSQEVIQRAYQEFSSYDLIISSRLHGHIFSCLLGIPNRVCDNSYGKNSGYFNQWTKGIDYSAMYYE